MRRERLYRKKSYKALLLSIAVLVCSVPTVSYASSSTLQQIQQQEQIKDNLEKENEENKEDLADLKGEQKSLKGALEDLNADLQDISEHLADLEEQIDAKEAEITEMQNHLAEARETESWQYGCMEKQIQFNYLRGETSVFESILSAGSFGNMLNQAVFFESMAEYNADMLDDIIATREYIESEEDRLQKENEALSVLRLLAESEKNKVMERITQTSNSIADYADQISDVEADIQAREDELKQVEEDLEALREKYQEELALSQLAANSAWRDISEVEFAEGDRYLLANLIYCEAGGEPYAGQLAVGAVVINRVLSSRYPDTVVGVIYQNKQFSPVLNGHLALALTYNKATANCYKAADEAMSGVTNVGSCVYFRTPIEGLTGISIGGHIFY
ncbi:MAG: cell wall hydrolase [Lachnospiraceae bacterium]|nr:cell wall hydrolase [Lachnospiraceae bacterium]